MESSVTIDSCLRFAVLQFHQFHIANKTEMPCQVEISVMYVKNREVYQAQRSYRPHGVPLQRVIHHNEVSKGNVTGVEMSHNLYVDPYLT